MARMHRSLFREAISTLDASARNVARSRSVVSAASASRWSVSSTSHHTTRPSAPHEGWASKLCSPMWPRTEAAPPPSVRPGTAPAPAKSACARASQEGAVSAMPDPGTMASSSDAAAAFTSTTVPHRSAMTTGYGAVSQTPGAGGF